MKLDDEKEHDRLLLILHTAWSLLDATELVKCLSEDFQYDSMHVFESLDADGFRKYIVAKFDAIQKSSNKPKVSIVLDRWMGGNMLKLEQGKTIGFLRLRCREGKICKLDMCDF